MIDKLEFKNFKSKRVILTGLSLFVFSIILGSFYSRTIGIVAVLAIIGLELLFLEVLRKFILKKSSIRILGLSILVISILNFLRHIWFFNYLLFYYDEVKDEVFIIVSNVFWFFTSLWLLIIGIRLIYKRNFFVFDEYLKTMEFKMIVLFVLVLFILEIPIFDFHDGWSCFHGHSFFEEPHIH